VIYTPPELRELETRKRELLDKKSTAYQEHDFEKMALHQMEITRVEDELREKREALTETHSKADRIVTEDDISSIISRSTGIPANRIVEEEVEKLKDIEAAFKKRIIGQDHVVESVSNAIRRNRAGLRRANRPVASFLFLGPTGVGKTEMVKAIAEQVMDDENRIIRVDMSEYMERHSVARLIGSPPGYVGYGEGGQLTEKVRRQPYSVVLFDEFEKAHPDVFNILLQVLDEGWLTDGEGRRVSFRNCIIVGTSNIGSEVLTDRKRPVGLGVQFSDWDKDDENKAVLEEVKKILRPEFINRIDEMIIFNRLGMGELGQILDLQIADLGKRVGDLGLSLEFDQEAKKLILAGIDTTNYGARPVRRALEQIVENQVAATLIGADGAQTGKNLKVGAKNGEIVISLT
jgi:ATP-dependent Clp protease ATP-binding subunit ClpC